MPRHPALNPDQLEVLKTLWLAGTESGEIAARLGVALSTVHKARARIGLPERCGKYTKRDKDPTPEEIAERSRECRERHFAERRRETVECSRIKAWRHDKQSPIA